MGVRSDANRGAMLDLNVTKWNQLGSIYIDVYVNLFWYCGCRVGCVMVICLCSHCSYCEVAAVFLRKCNFAQMHTAFCYRVSIFSNLYLAS